MTHKHIIALLLATLAISSAQAYTHQLDSIVRTAEDGISKFEPIYDTQMQAYGYTHYVRNGKDWDNHARTLFEHDANGNCTTIATYLWHNNAWAETTQETFAYNAQNLITEHAIRQNSSSGWIDSVKSIYNYDTYGRPTSEIHYKAQDGTLQYSKKSEYTYCENTVTTLNYSGLPGQIWKVADRITNIYANNKLTSSIYEINFNSNWLTSYKYEYEYTASVTIEKRYNYISDTEWKLKAQKCYFYNDAGQEIGYSETIDGSKKDSTIHTYTTQGDLETYARYAISAGSWNKTYDETYTHANTPTDHCAGAAFAQQQITTAGQHAQIVATFVRNENGKPTCTDTYYMHALQPTKLADSMLTDIYAANGRIFSSTPMRIYTLTGIDVTAQNGQLRGIYIVVQSDGQTAKIVVK